MLTSSPYKSELEDLHTKRKVVTKKQKKTTNSTGKLKVKTRQKGKVNKEDTSASDSDEDDAECLYCGSLYSQSSEGWSYNAFLEEKESREKKKLLEEQKDLERKAEEKEQLEKLKNQKRTIEEDEQKLKKCRKEYKEIEGSGLTLLDEANERLIKALKKRDFKEVALAQAMIEGAKKVQVQAAETKRQLAPDCMFAEFVTADDNVAVWGTQDDDSDDVKGQEPSDEEEEEEEGEGEAEEPEVVPTSSKLGMSMNIF
ncbi:glutamic acid-rich protein-like [Bacillus rossius redtenbacheri]|uniref:glutamic acid-rich protein-like n=1 Tax=Bacillus rossius redtenbacheri TaxID=93214 RepID=UPI002FDD1C17